MNAPLSMARSILWGSVCCLMFSAAHAADWPYAPVKLAAPAAAHGGAASAGPGNDCQPDDFDPKTTPYRAAAPVTASAPVATYQVEGAAGASMTINSRVKPDDAKVALAAPLAVNRYFFTCASGASEAMEFTKDGKRNAIFTHVSQAQFTRHPTHLVLYNYAKPHHGGWQDLRRIYDIRARRFVPLPMMRETDFLADAGDEWVLTYGLPANNKPGTVALWALNGKLLAAWALPLRAAANGRGAIDPAGLLPDEASTLYFLSRSGDNEATLWLQDARNAQGRRALKLAVPGAAADSAANHVQLDLAGLSLKGGALKYRTSASGKGDDWGEWQKAD